VAVSAITLVLTTLLLEGALRLFAPQISTPAPRTLFTSDRGSRTRNAPGAHVVHDSAEFKVTYDINQQGLRANSDTGPATPGRTRLLVIGDSFTFGWGVAADQAFPALLDGRHGANGQPVESLNAGVAGFGTDDEVGWMHEYGWALQPQVVLVGFFVGNDVEDVMRHITRSREDSPETRQVIAAGAQARELRRAQPDLQAWLEANAHSYVFLQRLLTPFLPPDAVRPPDVLDEAYTYLQPEPPDLAVGWQHTLQLLDEMQQKAREHQARLVVVAIPAAEQVNDGQWQALATTFHLAGTALDRDRPQQRLQAWSTQAGVPVIDLLPGFRAAHDSRLYFHADPHWTPAGQALAAQLIGTELRQLGILHP